MNPHIGAQYGGAGLGVVEDCIIGEEVAYACTSVSTAMTANSLGVSCGMIGVLWFQFWYVLVLYAVAMSKVNPNQLARISSIEVFANFK